MNDDIVTRLRMCESEYGSGDTCREAADEIEYLRKYIEAQRQEIRDRIAYSNALQEQLHECRGTGAKVVKGPKSDGVYPPGARRD